MINAQQRQKLAVECGYTVLYRYDPRKEKPLQIDSKAPNWDKFQDYLLAEARYFNLPRIKGQEEAERLFAKAKADAQVRYEKLMKKVKIQNEE